MNSTNSIRDEVFYRNMSFDGLCEETFIEILLKLRSSDEDFRNKESYEGGELC